MPGQSVQAMVNTLKRLIEYEKKEHAWEARNNYMVENSNQVQTNSPKKDAKDNKSMKYAGPILMGIGAIVFTLIMVFLSKQAGYVIGAIVFGGIPFLLGIICTVQAFGKKQNKTKEKITQPTQTKIVETNTRGGSTRLEYLNELVPTICAELKKYKQEYSSKVKPIWETANTYYTILREEFSLLLDERDWQHLDLIIFYFETGRADSMKEALSMVDRELQTDRIVEAVHQAARMICSSIERQTEVLQRTMVACCAHLSEQLSSIETQLAVQNAQLSGLLDAAHMNNALLRHANDSSKQLYEDATRVCHLIEAREIRRIS